MRALSVTFSERSLLNGPGFAAAVSFSICLDPATADAGQCKDVGCLAEHKFFRCATGAVRILADGARATGPTIRGPTKGCRADALVLEKREPLFRSASGAGQRACPKTGSPARTSATALAESLVAAPTAEGRAARAGGDGRIHVLGGRPQLTRGRMNKPFSTLTILGDTERVSLALGATHRLPSKSAPEACGVERNSASFDSLSAGDA